MPTYRSITISLISQFDILTIPEYAPPTTPTDPFSNAPKLVNPDHSLVSVYIPTYPSSQFWISYSISPPHPPQLLYYFKLYLNGDLVVSWGCGEDDDYRGKTMFGLFKSAHISGLTNEAALQRRVLCFGADTATIHGNSMDNLDHVMEIKVFRSKGRKRIKPDVPSIDMRRSQPQATSGIDLVNAGDMPDKNPQRYYRYLLLDPLDAPFATFRYYYRSWDQLEALGVISPYSSGSSSTDSIESSSVNSQENIAENPERQLSPRGSSNTLGSFVSMSASSDNTATNGASHEAEEPKTTRTIEAATATVPAKSSIQEPSKRNMSEGPSKGTTDDDAESQSTKNSPEVSPLKIPFFLPRPPTPPPSSTPPKLAQLPNSIPPTTKDFNTLASKESFASLIRKRLPDPDPSAFQLTDPNPAAEPPGPTLPTLPTAGSLGKRSGTGSVRVLMNVVNSAKNRRRREMAAAAAAAAAASEEERSEGGERTDGEVGESTSVGSGSEGSGAMSGGQVRAGERGKEGRKEGKGKGKAGGEKRRGGEGGEGNRPEQPRRRERRRNLWEEL